MERPSAWHARQSRTEIGERRPLVGKGLHFTIPRRFIGLLFRTALDRSAGLRVWKGLGGETLMPFVSLW